MKQKGFFRFVPEGGSPPWWAGLCWPEPGLFGYRVAPIPLNLVVRVLWAIGYFIRRPFRFFDAAMMESYYRKRCWDLEKELGEATMYAEGLRTALGRQVQEPLAVTGNKVVLTESGNP